MRKKQFGEWVNAESLHLTKVRDERYCFLWSVTIYRVNLDVDNPPYWKSPDGSQILMGQPFNSDGGSIPPFLQSIPGLSDDRFLLSYCGHDFGCKYGGLFFRGHEDADYHFRRLTRLDVDNYLRLWVGAEGGNAAQREMIYRGVRLGAGFQRFPSIGYWDEKVG